MIHPKDVFQLSPQAGDGQFVFTWKVPGDLPYFDGHFPGNPILPAIAVVDGTVEAIRQASNQAGLTLQKIKSGKFSCPIVPGDSIRITVTAGDAAWDARWELTSTAKTCAELKGIIFSKPNR